MNTEEETLRRVQDVWTSPVKEARVEFPRDRAALDDLVRSIAREVTNEVQELQRPYETPITTEMLLRPVE